MVYHEDILMDIKDKIIICLVDMNARSPQLKLDDLITQISGRREFFVRKIQNLNEKAQRARFGGNQTGDYRWTWRSCNDFDRIIKFSDDEVHREEVIFKLVNKVGST